MRTSFFIIGIAVIAVLGFAAVSFAQTDARAKPPGDFMAPHAALYDIRMIRKKSGTPIIHIRGQMMYEWQPVCDAWTSAHHFRLQYEYADAPPVRIASDFTTYEDFSGESFSFTTRRVRDGQLYEELRGRAVMDGTHGGGQVTYSVPPGKSASLPQGTLFPVSHSIALLKQQAAGARFFRATLFDGSDEDGRMEVNAVFLGPSADPARMPAPSARIDADLLKSPAHHARLAFFPLQKTQDTADFEMDVILHENGIISDMNVDYGDFAVSQKLAGLRALPDGCAPSSGKTAEPPPR